MVEGIGALHKYGFAHKDIKLKNTLIDAQNMNAIVSDFGLVKEADEDNKTADWLSVGKVLTELMTLQGE